MQRKINNVDYLDWLPNDTARAAYYRWHDRIIVQVDEVAAALEHHPVKEVMQMYKLSVRDIGLMVRLRYFTDEEIQKYNLRTIERRAPL